MYKEFAKSESDTWDDIARRAYGTTEKAGDIEKMNNGIKSGNVLVLEESDSDENIEATGEVFLRHGEQNDNDFSQYSLLDGMEAIKGALFIFNRTDVKYNFTFNDSAAVYDEEGLFLKGRIANIKPCLTKSANWFQVEVISHAGVLGKTKMPYPLEFSNVSIEEILTQVAGYYNQKIEFSSEPELKEVFVNEIGTSFTAEIGETVWDFMKRLCNSRGLILTDTGNGLFVGRFKPNTEEKLNLIDGECLGVEEIRAEFNTVGLARYYEVNSQYPETDTATVQIPYPVPVTKRFNSNDYNAGNLDSIAAQFACRDIGEHFKLTYLLSENYPIRCGSFAIVKNEKILVNEETDFVIENIVRKHPDAAIITLTLPCKYTFEIPEKLPLCS